MDKQIKSRQRVADHGEVLTGKREVNAMLDLVKQETERIDSRFLEPACGTGNFLTEILKRKLEVVRKKYGKSQFEYERNAIIAVASIYGIDILEDNVLQCRQHLFGVFECDYSDLFKETKDECRRAVRYILEQNIVWGDALSLKTAGENPQPIIFAEWSPVNGRLIKRRDYEFEDLIAHGENSKQLSMLDEPEQLNFFCDLTGEPVFSPTVKRDYSPVPFLKIGEMEDDIELR